MFNRSACTLVLGLIVTSLAAQDTLRVQTLTFDSITTRRGCWVFPDTTHTYRKVLMHHTLKCDPQTTQDQYPCGEWDYLTYNMVHKHTGLLDSNALQHPWFRVGVQAPDSVEQTTLPGANSWARQVLSGSVLSVNNETVSAMGLGNAVDTVALDNSFLTVRSQYLYTANELANAGVLAGAPITQIRLPLVSGNGLARLVVRLGATTNTTQTDFQEADMVTVFDNTLDLSADTLVLTLGQPFHYDGIGNLVLELALYDQVPLVGATLIATDDGQPMGVQQQGADGYVQLNNDFIGVKADSLATLGSAVTITLRVWGGDVLPVNTTVLEAVDAQERRILNVHLPWSDSRVYWDAGNDGSGYDRIDKAATANDIKGQWNDWAFVKNTASGSMKIYLNGVLWHSGTGKTKPLSGITRFKLGSDANGNIPYQGKLDEVNIFRTEVSAATIAAWAGRKVDASHPDHNMLMQQFSFDEPPGTHYTVNLKNPAEKAWCMGTVRRDRVPATELNSAPQQLTHRPDVIFVQGDHLIQLDTNVVMDQVPREQLSIEHFAVQGNSVVPVDTLFGGLGGWNYTYDLGGNVIDSNIWAGTWHFNNTLYYFSTPFPEVIDYELGRYITPYGIGLSLGASGFRWTFDVTDYQWLLHDSVELSAGNQQELIDLEFEMIEGTPARPVVRHTRPWGGLSSYSYANLDNDVSLPAVTVTTHPDATQWNLRTRFTGHGHNSNNGQYPHCCEWKDNTHYAFANGAQIDEWHIWQENDCALNPVYPQGGTWLGSREGWCPGDLVKDHSIEITPYVSGGQVTLDYDITPVPANNQGMGGGNYVVNMDLFEYGPSAHTLDAEVYMVKRPNNDAYYGRENPMCTPPLVTLRNAGSTALTSATFTYSVSGGNPLTHTWNGDLAIGETVDVELPVTDGAFWQGDGTNQFTVSVSAPNGGVDAYADNNAYTTDFELPEVFAGNFIINYRTNNRPWENTLTVTDMWGSVVHSRTNHTSNTVYSDTLSLWDGCYTLEFLDSGNDGLTYWADTQQGSGYFRFRSLTGSLLENFETEFGRRIFKAFVIGNLVGMEEQAPGMGFSVFPNPNDGRFTLRADGLDGPQKLRVLDMSGRVVLNEQWNTTTSTMRTIDLGDAANGIYVVTLSSPEGTLQQRILVD